MPFWFIAEAEAATSLGLAPSAGGGPSVRHVDALTPAALAGVMAEALAANPVAGDVVTTWEEIRVYATEVKLPASLAGRDVLWIGPDGYSFGVPVRSKADGAWVRGPFPMGELPPFSLHFTGPFVRARLTTFWSIWTPDGSGAADVDQVVPALEAAGWTSSP